MKRRTKKLLQRFATGSLAVMLSVAMNINPLATIAGAVADSGVVDKFGILKDNLVYIAKNGNTVDEVLAADGDPDTSSLDDVITMLRYIYNDMIWENHFDYMWNDALYADGDTIAEHAAGIREKLEQFRRETGNNFEMIDTDIKLFQNSVETHFGIVEEQLSHISEQLDMINENIDDMQHNYRVAHLYSLNAEFDNALWRPYTQDVPYVKDFATVMGQFASVYTGYWDTAITEMNRPGGAKAERALEVLGYDAIVRYEGVILTDEISQSDPLDAQTRNMRIGILGDSISTFTGEIPVDYSPFYPYGDITDKAQTWWGKLIEDNNFTKAGNSSYSGCYALPVEGEDDEITGYNQARVNNLKGDDGTNPDIVIVYLGTNDIGAVDGSRFTLTEQEKDDNNAEMSFEMAYAKVVDTIEKTLPSAYVFCCLIPPQCWGGGSEPNKDGLDHIYTDYNEVIRNIAVQYQCGIVDFESLWAEDEIDANTLDGDGVHPNVDGMEKMAEAAKSAIEQSNIIGHVNSGVGSTTVMNKPNGQSGEHESYDMTGNTNPKSLAVLYQEFIPKDEITWLDAVSVLYKAVGQPLYTYQTFQTYNSRITPETSPAYQSLSNIVPDEAGVYEGYDFYMFLNRNNTVSGNVNNYNMTALYWQKALNEQFVSSRTDMNSPITASEFYILASKMMQAYGEPVMNQDEIKALLQVYGSDYPVNLGFEIADAWAYLKVRGCLNVDLVPSGYMTRDDLLDICMCIADEDSRTDYKNIDIVLDLGDLLRDDGYYPVYDLNFSNGAFSATDIYDYSKMTLYTYLIAKLPGYDLGETGMLRAYSVPQVDESKVIQNANCMSNRIEIEGTEYYIVQIPMEYNMSVYLGMVNSQTDTVMGGSVDWIELPGSSLGGGIYTGGYDISIGQNGTIATINITDTNWFPFDYQEGNAQLLKYADYKRAGKGKPKASTVASNATIKERLIGTISYMFSPLEVEAANVSDFEGGTTIAFADGEEERVLTAISSPITVSKDAMLPYSDVEIKGIKVADSGSERLVYNRLYYLSQGSINSGLRQYMKQGASFASIAKTYYSSGHAVEWLPASLMQDAAWITNQTTSIFGSGGNSQIKNTADWHEFSQPYSEQEIAKYNQVLALYALGANPVGGLISVDKSVGDSLSIGSGLSFDSTNTDEYEKLLNKIKSETKTEQAILTLISEYDATVSYSDKKYTMRLKAGANGSDARDIIGASTSGDTANLSKSVATTAVMSREEQILLSWEDMRAAGIVYSTQDGGQPKLNKDGSYYFMTRDGQVKVNNDKKTIQVGTTLYDLDYTTGKSPELVYIDNDQNGMMYFDVRCVTGIMTAGYVRNDEKTEALHSSFGSGNYAVYDISPNGVTGSEFSLKHVNCYNYPQIDNAVNMSEHKPGNTSYAVSIVRSTNYDGEEYGDNGFIYFDQGSPQSRFLLSSFVPTANWITVIEDDGANYDANLYVYYPRVVFEDIAEGGGYVDSAGASPVEVKPPSDADKRWSDLSAKLDEAAGKKNSSGTNVKEMLLDLYGIDNIDSAVWWKKMTVEAVTDLYLQTGKYYISPDYVVRKFRLSANTATVVEAWAEYDSTENDTFEESTALYSGEDYYKYTDAGNATGAIYWVEGIGYIYNMPSQEEFTLEKYLSGEYPLPLAYFGSGTANTSSIAGVYNYNMNYYGVAINKNGMEIDTKVPYGYVLCDLGYVHYKATPATAASMVLQGCDFDSLPHSENADGTAAVDDANQYLYPYKISGDTPDDLQHLTLAPAGIYMYFGGNDIINTKVKSLNEYNTRINYYYYGSSRIRLCVQNSDTSSAKFWFDSDLYNPIALNSEQEFYRVWQGRNSEAYISKDNSIRMASGMDVGDVNSEDWLPDSLSNWLDGLGSNDLITAIDEGSSILILIAFWVLPIIGIILMTILVGLSFISDNKTVQYIVERTFDPIRLLTWGGRDIYNWHWNKVLVPCILLYITFALFLNGNIIRIIMFLAKWYDVVSQWIRTIF